MKYLSIILFLLYSFSARADYGYRSLSEVVEECDYGVVGTIIKVDAEYFWVKVDSVVYGDVTKGSVCLVKFKNWGCGRRYAAYEVGQKEVVFYRKHNDSTKKYSYIGYGGGGEFELKIRDHKYVQYKYAYDSKHFVEFSLDTFITAVNDYKNLQKRVQNKETITNAMLDEFSNRSTVHSFLIKYQSLIKRPSVIYRSN